jgi:hypothetical protein
LSFDCNSWLIEFIIITLSKIRFLGFFVLTDFVGFVRFALVAVGISALRDIDLEYDKDYLVSVKRSCF